MGFKVSYTDPCLFHRRDKNGITLMVVHIEDCYVIGHKKALVSLVNELKSSGLKAKVSSTATDYLSCDICVDKNQQCAWIGQTALMKKVIKKFTPLIKQSAFQYKTPDSPGQILSRPKEGDTGILSTSDQTLYRSGVGTLLQFSKKHNLTLLTLFESYQSQWMLHLQQH
jgi:hypothetical protein